MSKDAKSAGYEAREAKPAAKQSEAKKDTKIAASKNVGNTGSSEKLAIVRIRSSANVRGDIRDTMDMLRLYNQHSCSVYGKTPSVLGMLGKIKDYVTWGEIDSETLRLLEEKRKVKDKEFYSLHPPRGGFERKGIKKSFKIGGALGYRGDKINALIQKMV